MHIPPLHVIKKRRESAPRQGEISSITIYCNLPLYKPVMVWGMAALS